MSEGIEVVEVVTGGVVELTWAPEDDLEGAEVVSVSTPPAPGDPPTGVAPYVHTQMVAQSVVTITHGRGHRPAAVSLFSTDWITTFQEYGVEHLTVNSVRITMDDPTPFIALIG